MEDKNLTQTLDMEGYGAPFPDLVNEKLQQKSKELSEREVRYRALLHSVFDTDDGKKLLEAWEHSFLYSPCYNPSQGDQHIYIREGENKFVRKILIDINLHMNHKEGV